MQSINSSRQNATSLHSTELVRQRSTSGNIQMLWNSHLSVCIILLYNKVLKQFIYIQFSVQRKTYAISEAYCPLWKISTHLHITTTENNCKRKQGCESFVGERLGCILGNKFFGYVIFGESNMCSCENFCQRHYKNKFKTVIFYNIYLWLF